MQIGNFQFHLGLPLLTNWSTAREKCQTRQQPWLQAPDRAGNACEKNAPVVSGVLIRSCDKPNDKNRAKNEDSFLPWLSVVPKQRYSTRGCDKEAGVIYPQFFRIQTPHPFLGAIFNAGCVYDDTSLRTWHMANGSHETRGGDPVTRIRASCSGCQPSAWE